MIVDITRFRDLSRRTQAGLAAVLMTVATIAPVLMQGTVGAAPALLQRKLESTSAVPAGATDLTWTFNTTTDTANVSKIEIEFCDSPLTLCGSGTENGTDNTTVAGDAIPILPASPSVTLSNFTTNTTTSATRVNGRAGATSNQIDITKTTADSGTSLTGASIAITGFTNDETANKTYYSRMRLYSDAGTTLVWEGIFAQSTSQTLTVNARVQERLDFCVGATAVNDATTSVGATCVDVAGNSVDIGNIENSNVNVSPVATINGGSNTNGVAMIRTNAVNGAVVDYRALQNTSSGSLKVPSATCGDTGPFGTGTTTDQCFNSAATTTVTAGEEEFGMVIGGVNCGSTTAYTCSFAGGTNNLVRDPDYDGEAAPNTNFVTDTNAVASVTSGQYTWIDTGVIDRIASSGGSTVKVIDDEAMILKFAATAGITTPTGAYSVQADFIATTTF